MGLQQAESDLNYQISPILSTHVWHLKLVKGSYIGRYKSIPITTHQSGFEHVPAILRGKAINPFIPKHLIDSSRPISFTRWIIVIGCIVCKTRGQ